MTTRSTEATLKNLPIEQLQASTTNPRQHFDRAALDELKASIAESGIQVPLLCRPVLELGQVVAYEVVAGERRLRAAHELSLEELPCLVRELTDEEARECQIVENLQRAGVHPIEEAEALGELLARLGSIAAVAAKLGKEESYVAKCLRLQSLTLWSADALVGRLITIEHALLLARLAKAEQDEALKWTIDHTAGSKKPVDKVVGERIAALKEDAENPREHFRHWVWEPQSVAKLKSHIEERSGVDLSRAPWPLEADTLLPEVCACSECPKNTRANVPLFGDLDIGEPTCTDGACFKEKTVEFVRIAQLEAGHDPKGGTLKAVPRLSWKASSVKPSIVSNGSVDAKGLAEMANPAKLLKYGQWIDAKKGSCPNVRAGVTADWSDSGDRGYMSSGKTLRKPGETLQVCIASGCKVHRKGYEGQKAASVDNGKTQQEREAERAAREKLEGEIKAVEPKLRGLIFGAILGKLDGARALRIANDERQSAPDFRKRILECRPGISGDELEALTAFGCVFSQAFSVNAYYMSVGGVKEDRSDLWKLAKLAGVNADQVAAKAFHDGLTPSLTCLYPRGIPWPGQEKSAKKKPAVKKAVKPTIAKKAAKRPAKNLDAAGRKRIADAMKKRWADRSKKAKA